MKNLFCWCLVAGLLTHLGGQALAQDVWDMSGFDRHGTFTTGVPPVFVDDGSGPFGTPYYDFGGAMAASDVPSDWGLGGSYTMSLWFEGYDIASLGANAVIAGSYADGSVPGFGLYFQGSGGKQNTLTFYHVSTTSPFTFVGAGTTQNMGSGWHNATAVFEEGVGLSFYLDGSLEQFSPSTVPGVSVFAKPFTVGGQDYSAPRTFDNGIDEVKLFNRALSAAEVAELVASNTATGAVLDWTFDAQGPPRPVDVPDFSGNERHGYYKGTARCVDDGSGPAGLYYAADGASMIESDWIPGELTGSYSVAAWFEGHDAASTNEVIFGSYADGSAPGFVLQFVGDPRHGDDQLLAFHVSKTSPFTYSSVKSPQSYHEGWHQAVLVFEEAVGLRLYVDGDFVAENTSLGEGIGEFALPFTAGGQAYKTERNFNGGLDEILVYDRALTAGEIAGLYANTIPAGALLHWGCIPEPGVAVFLAGLVFAGLFRRNRRA